MSRNNRYAPETISLDEFCQRLQPKSNIWSVLVGKPPGTIVRDLRERIAGSETFAADEGADDIVRKLGETDDDYAILWGFQRWSCRDWHRFNAFRSLLDRGNRGGVLVLSSGALRGMLRCAPHFASWVGARIYTLP